MNVPIQTTSCQRLVDSRYSRIPAKYFEGFSSRSVHIISQSSGNKRIIWYNPAPLECGSSQYTVHGVLWSGQPFPSPGEFPNPGTEPRSPALQADSLPAEPQAKPKNTGVGSLSLLQQLFQTHELNQDCLHCREILYQLSYQGSPQ